MSDQTVPPSAINDFPRHYARTARFSLGSPRNISVVGDGARVLFCRSHRADDPTLCLWSLEVGSGEERLLVDPAGLVSDDHDLPPAERARRERARESASGIVAFTTDASGSTVCFALAGVLFVVDVESGAVTVPDIDGIVFDPRFSPDGSAIAYVDQGKLRLVGVGSEVTADRILRHDPDPLVSHGRAEFVAAEEMGRSRGYWWAPDGRGLLVTRVDENPVTQWWIADPARPERAPNPVRYPAAGTVNAAIGLELVGLDGGVVAIDWSDDGRYEYLADVIWVDDHEPLVVRQTRDQRLVSIGSVDTGSGAVTDRHSISDDIWVELHPGTPRWFGSQLLTIEDHGQVRRLALDGVALTGDELQVRSLLGVVERADDPVAVVAASTVGAPTEIHLHLVPLAPPADDAAGATRQITSVRGVHSGVLAGSVLVVTSHTPDQHRPSIALHRLDGVTAAGGDIAATATIGDRSADPGFAAAPTFIPLGERQLESALFLPHDHDGTTPLPVLLDPYGGPHAQRVLRTHNSHLVSRWFAEQGYAVLVTDGRGTPGRGPAWEQAVAGDLASPVLDDQVAALEAALDRYQFLDASRVGIRGWSFGGYLAALAVLRRPDRFHAAVAGAPVTTWRLYDTHYTERYLGHPGLDPGPYDHSDLWVDGQDGPQLPPLTRPLLLIHGLADDNVVAAHTLRFSTALLATGSPHRVLPLAGVTHMTPQLAVAENLLRLQLAFLDETLRGAKP